MVCYVYKTDVCFSIFGYTQCLKVKQSSEESLEQWVCVERKEKHIPEKLGHGCPLLFCFSSNIVLYLSVLKMTKLFSMLSRGKVVFTAVSL